MPKIPSVSSKIFCKFLVKNGCSLARIEGDHYIFTKEGIFRPIVVPTRKQLPTFIILNNLKTLKISRNDYLKLLKQV
jgi:predicted RNA binding protein YcfA (HicA-like mRNA interferase family)